MWKHVLKSNDNDYVCDGCKLHGDEMCDAWEGFLNGSWVKTKPAKAGWYPVKSRGHIVYIEVIQVGDGFAWVNDTSNRPIRWSEPLPEVF